MVARRRVGIGIVEREIGIPKETLRIWERRYGWPIPSRSPSGERLYGEDELIKLRLIKQLLDRGFRPGGLVDATPAKLRALVAAESDPTKMARPAAVDRVLQLLEARRIVELQRSLRDDLRESGVSAFVLNLVRPLCQAIGDGWEAGDYSVFEEHIVTEQVQIALRSAIASSSVPSTGPSVLLTTLPGEEHGLGLLMLQAILSAEGARCISLGLQTPATEIAACCAAENVEIVMLSFSAHFARRGLAEALLDLRALIAPAVEIWAGGAGVHSLLRRERPSGVLLMSSLEQGVEALNRMQRKTQVSSK